MNPNGYNNFTDIDGIHLDGRTDDDVEYIASVPLLSRSINVPSIICNKFLNVNFIYLNLIGLERIDGNTFDSCKNLRQLALHNNLITILPDNVFDHLTNLEILALSGNKLTNISIEWFKNLQNLKTLYLNHNTFEDIPKNTFSPLNKLTDLYLHTNKFEIIHSESFGVLPNLKELSLRENVIIAFDERIIDMTGVEAIDMTATRCANGYIFDNSTGRELMRTELLYCFYNFVNLFPGK